MNLELAYSILEILHTMQEAVGQMKDKYVAGEMEDFDTLATDIRDGLTAVQEIARHHVPEGSEIRLADACTCALESLKDIMKLVQTKSEKVEWKLEYELAPIIETSAMQFYYWGIVDEHPEKRKEFELFIAQADAFERLRMSEKEQECLDDLVIVVTGYNHLEYTVRCVESILENWPKGIKAQLVLFNHGSSDATKAYFESIEKAKTINVAVNGVMPCVTHKAISRGKYNLNVSNDIVIGKNAIDNLYRCAVENKDYGYIVPTTPAVSNFQTIPADYTTEEGFVKFASDNNNYDEKRHEQRVRLCNPLHIMPAQPFTQLTLDLYEDKCCNRLKISFPDDKNSLWMRRNGYKCILAKDAYCHHFGSITLKADAGTLEKQHQFYEDGRKDFEKKYGVDPWGLGCHYDKSLFDVWKFPIIDKATILGLNCGLGSNSLKVKEILKENGAKDVLLYNGTQDERYLLDLKGVSDKAFCFDNLSDVVEEGGKTKYNYIVVEATADNDELQAAVHQIAVAGLQFDELAYKSLKGEWQIVKWTKES